MIVQPTREQTRKIDRSRGRAYSGPGFGPRSFECLGLGLGLGIGLNSGSGAAPNPLSILGAAATKLWLRADLGVSGLGTAGASWVDQSGNWANPFLQATVANQAALAVDGTINQLAFTFDGTNDFWSSAGTSLPLQSSNPFAFILVAQISSFAVAAKPLIGATQFRPAIATQAASTLGPQSGSIGPKVAGDTAWKRIICELTNSTADRIQQGSASVTGVSSGTLQNSGLYIGGVSTTPAYLACSVAEVIVVEPIPVSYTEIDSYLAARYGAPILT